MGVELWIHLFLALTLDVGDWPN